MSNGFLKLTYPLRTFKRSPKKILIFCVAVTLILFYLSSNNNRRVQKNQNRFESDQGSVKQSNIDIKTNTPTKNRKHLDHVRNIPRASVCPTDEISGNYPMISINPAENRSKVILVWNRPVDWLYKNTKDRCEYKNCYFIDDKCDITRSDAVIFHSPTLNLQHVLKKIPGQIFVYFSFEPPSITRGRVKDQKWQNVFNWTFHYRRDSDIMQPYVLFTKRSQKKGVNLEDLVRNKTKSIAWFVSHCKTESRREKYVDILQKHFNVDIYGKCGPLKCYSMANRWKCLDMLNNYQFYLGFENSICRDYVTEKQLFTAYKKNNVIPVTRGSSQSYLYKPPGTYIDTENFKTVTDLTNFLKNVASDSTKYKSYFKIRNHFSVEEPWHHSVCELCKRLNNVGRYKRLYNNLHIWEHEIDGQPVCDENPNDYARI